MKLSNNQIKILLRALDVAGEVLDYYDEEIMSLVDLLLNNIVGDNNYVEAQRKMFHKKFNEYNIW